MKDTEQQVCADIFARQQRGIRKYGTTVAQNPLELCEWLQHQYEELLDAAVYCKRAIQELERMAARDAKLAKYIGEIGERNAGT